METLHYNYFQKSQKTIIDIIKAKRSWKFRAMTERERERERTVSSLLERGSYFFNQKMN